MRLKYLPSEIYFDSRLQLLGGLDMGRSQPSCPFPSCTATSWPIVDNLLLHYASDHHVIEKIMFFETEAIIRDLRKEVATKDEIVESLLSDNAELKEKVFIARITKCNILHKSILSIKVQCLPQGILSCQTWTVCWS